MKVAVTSKEIVMPGMYKLPFTIIDNAANVVYRGEVATQGGVSTKSARAQYVAACIGFKVEPQSADDLHVVVG